MTRGRGGVALLLVGLAWLAAGCRDDGGTAATDERQLRLIAPAGYVENGSSDPAVDWVTPFRRATGCRVRVQIANTTDEAVALMRGGAYDGALVSSDATGLLVAAGSIAPVDTGRLPHYADVFGALRRLRSSSVGGRTYGIPQGRAANVLMWRTDVVRPAPDSWGVVFDPSSPYRGRLTAYDSSLSIAEAALYLKATRPGLGIDDVYELDDRQFRAALTLVRRQYRIIGNDWGDYVQEQAAFVAGTSVVGASWQLVAQLLKADGVPVATTLPKEGATGWADLWVVSSRARHSGCMYRWLDWMLSPAVNAQVAEWVGVAPASAKACARTANPRHCAIYHARDEAYFSRVAFWTTPRRDCGDERGAVCKDYAAWSRAWEEITG